MLDSCCNVLQCCNVEMFEVSQVSLILTLSKSETLSRAAYIGKNDHIYASATDIHKFLLYKILPEL